MSFLGSACGIPSGCRTSSAFSAKPKTPELVNLLVRGLRFSEEAELHSATARCGASSDRLTAWKFLENTRSFLSALDTLARKCLKNRSTCLDRRAFFWHFYCCPFKARSKLLNYKEGSNSTRPSKAQIESTLRKSSFATGGGCNSTPSRFSPSNR